MKRLLLFSAILSLNSCSLFVDLLLQCGNNKQNGNEACDDGNTTSGDGCDANCLIEDGFDCTGEPSTCSAQCGDGDVGIGLEECDDGNTINGDGCDNNCTISACGNGIIADNEECDDAATIDGDGCSADCKVEDGFDCVGVPSVCTSIEDCTDGADNDGDALIDCLDPDCAADPTCIGIEICDNNTDDDGDNFVDCEDSDCAADPGCIVTEICDNNSDDDNDNLADCNDSDCFGLGPCQIELNCTDQQDNDNDSLTDCNDDDCFGVAPGCLTETNCTDEEDNDADGFSDCADPDCSGIVQCPFGFSSQSGDLQLGTHDLNAGRFLGNEATLAVFSPISNGTIFDQAIFFGTDELTLLPAIDLGISEQATASLISNINTATNTQELLAFFGAQARSIDGANASSLLAFSYPTASVRGACIIINAAGGALLDIATIGTDINNNGFIGLDIDVDPTTGLSSHISATPHTDPRFVLPAGALNGFQAVVVMDASGAIDVFNVQVGQLVNIGSSTFNVDGEVVQGLFFEAANSFVIFDDTQFTLIPRNGSCQANNCFGPPTTTAIPLEFGANFIVDAALIRVVGGLTKFVIATDAGIQVIEPNNAQPIAKIPRTGITELITADLAGNTNDDIAILRDGFFGEVVEVYKAK